MAAKDLNSKTVTELKAIAKKAGVTIKSSWKKTDIVKALAPAKSSGTSKKSPSKQKKKPAIKKTASKKTAKKAIKKTQAKKSAAKKTVKKSTKKVKKAVKKKAVKKATAKSSAKKTVKKTLKKVQKKASLKPAAKKTLRTVSGKSAPATSKKASDEKKQAVPSVPRDAEETAKKATAGRKSSTAKAKSQPAHEKISASAVQRERGTNTVTESPTTKATRVSLLVVDPYKLFAFWEINGKDLDNMVRDGEGFSFLLRVYFFREGEQTGFFDVKISEPFGKKYIEVIPERGYQLELLLIKRKASYSLARSSVKYTPSYRINKEFNSPEESEIYLSQVPRSGGRISS